MIMQYSSWLVYGVITAITYNRYGPKYQLTKPHLGNVLYHFFWHV